MFIHPTLFADTSGQILEEIAEQVTTKPEKILQGTEKMDGTQIAAMTIVGLAVVFAALLILVIFLYLSGGIFKKAGKQKKAEPVKAAPAPKSATAAAKPAAAKLPPKAPAPAAEDDSEVIAVIMAAIAAMGAADGKQYKLHSVRQVTRRGSGRSVWAQAGLNDATRPF